MGISIVLPAAQPATFIGTNGETSPMLRAMPIAQPTTTLRCACASSGYALSQALGLVMIGGNFTQPVKVLVAGALVLPELVWDAVTGGSGGLIPGAKYYLGNGPGQLTTTPTSTPGHYVVVIGNAINSTTLVISRSAPVLL